MINERGLYKYYIVLLAVLCTWVSTVSAPPLPIRLAYLTALIAPAFLSAPKLLVPVLVCFTSIASYGFSCSYMPTELYFYLGIMAVLLLLSLDKLYNTQRPPTILSIFCIYVIVIDYIAGAKLVNIDYSLLIILSSFFFVSKYGYEKEAYIICFVLVSIVLCIYYFTYGQSGIEVMEDGRVGWVDSNYMGNVCGMGVVLAYHVFINKMFAAKKLFSNTCLFTVVAGVIMLILNASRGAFLSMSIAVIVITLFAKIPLKKKIVIACIAVLFIVCVYNLGLFEVLEERVNSDDGTGNSRTIIWGKKMEAFSHLPFLQQLFGLGYKGGFDLAIPGGFGFHNDYLAFIVDYGYVGFILFIALMFYPITIVGCKSSNRPIVISLVLFLLTCSFTLEPFTAGRLTYWYFYMLIILFARWSQYDKYINEKIIH